ncbi:unnamed protein product [Musa acuminata subsp. burmannicoides]
MLKAEKTTPYNRIDYLRVWNMIDYSFAHLTFLQYCLHFSLETVVVPTYYKKLHKMKTTNMMRREEQLF